MPKRTIRIFVSSPGDVGQERLITRRVIERLQNEFDAYVNLEPILWEHEPLRATSHFQEQIVLPSQTDIVVCILWSRLGTRLPSNFKREDGTSYSSGTEWEFEDAARSFREKKIPDLLVYRKMDEPPINTNDSKCFFTLEQKKSLDKFIDRWFGTPQEGFNAAFHTFTSLDEFEDRVETHLRKLILNRIPEHVSKDELTVSWFRGSPFMGLKSFDREHSAVFYGRTRDIGRIKDAISYQASRGSAFMLILGKSGCGKSSLVKAGVIPTITQPGVIEGIEYWKSCFFRPGSSDGTLIDGLAVSLLSEGGLSGLKNNVIDFKNLSELLNNHIQTALEWIRKALEELAESEKRNNKLLSTPETRLVLVIDQLEEIYTMEKVSKEERIKFINIIGQLSRSGRVWIIATMRSDFYSRCSETPELIEMKKGKGYYDLMPPTFADIAQMIKNPSRAAGLRFEKKVDTSESLDEVLHEAASRNPEVLPLLEFTLDELYKRRTEDNILTFEAYEELGGLEGALASRAEEVLDSQDAPAKAAFRNVFRQLVTINAGNDAVISGRLASYESFNDREGERALVKALIEARLLVTDRTDTGEAVVGIAHEALLNHWPRLHKLIEEDKDFLRTRARVSQAGERWQQEGKNSDFLLPEGKQLSEAEYMLKDWEKDLEDNIKEYIRLSIKRVKQKKRQKKSAVTAVFLTLLCFAIVSFTQWQNANAQRAEAVKQTGIATEQKNEAVKQKQNADEQKNEAVKQKQNADEQRGEAIKQKNYAEGQTKIAETEREKAELSENEALKQKSIAEMQTVAANNERKKAETSEKEAVKQRDIAVAERDATLKTQSILLSQLSKQQVKEGHSNSAILLALEALPKNKDMSDRPYVIEGEEALYNALYSYREKCSLEPNADITILSSKFSPDNKYVAVVAANNTAQRGNNTAQLWDASTGKLRYMLSGHEDTVRYTDFSDDSKYMYTVSDDGKALLWSTDTGKQIAVLSEKYDKKPDNIMTFNLPKFSYDNSYTVSSDRGKALRLWDLKNNRLKADLTDVSGNIIYSDFINDGKQIAAVTDNALLEVWDTDTGKKISDKKLAAGAPDYVVISSNKKELFTRVNWKTIVKYDVASADIIAKMKAEDEVISMRLSPDGRTMAALLQDEAQGFIGGMQIRLWNAGDGSVIGDLKGHIQNISEYSFSPDSRYIATASNDCTARVWNAKTAGAVSVLTGHTSDVTGIKFTPDSSSVVTISNDETMRIWDPGTGNQLGLISKVKDDLSTESGLSHMDISRDGKYFLSVLGFKSVQVWERPNVVSLPDAPAEAGNEFSFNHKGDKVISTYKDKKVHITSVDSGKEICSLKGAVYIGNQPFSHDDRLIAGEMDDGIGIWNTETGELITSLNEKAGKGSIIMFGPDDSTIIITADDKTVRICDVKTGKEIFELKGHTDVISSISFTYDNNRIVTSSWDGSAIIWDIKTGKQIVRLDAHSGDVRYAACSPVNNNIVTVYGDGTARLWDGNSGTLISVLMGHSGHVMYTEFSKDGSYFITKGDTVRIWDGQTGKELNIISANKYFSGMSSASIGADDKNILASGNNSSYLWNLKYGKVLAQFPGDGSNIDGIMSPDGRHVLTKTWNGKMKLWDIFPNTNDLISYVQSNIHYKFTNSEMNKFFLENETYNKDYEILVDQANSLIETGMTFVSHDKDNNLKAMEMFQKGLSVLKDVDISKLDLGELKRKLQTQDDEVISRKNIKDELLEVQYKAYYDYAIAALISNSPDEAIQASNKALELNNTDKNAEITLATGYLLKGQFDEAANMYAGIIKDNGSKAEEYNNSILYLLKYLKGGNVQNELVDKAIKFVEDVKK